MSWWIIIVMAGAAYGFKLFGLEVLSRVALKSPFDSVAQLLPVALFASIIVQQSFGSAGSEVMGTRVAGIAAGAVAVWRKAPLLVVIALAAATSASLRRLV